MKQLELFPSETRSQSCPKIKAISLWQPWAWMIEAGLKCYETRHWYTSYRGPLIICSAQKKSKDLREFHIQFFDNYYAHYQYGKNVKIPEFNELRFGEALCLVNLVDCSEMVRVEPIYQVLFLQSAIALRSNSLMKWIFAKIIDGYNFRMSPLEILCGNWQPGRYAWKMEFIKVIKSVSVKGEQGFFNIDAELVL